MKFLYSGGKYYTWRGIGALYTNIAIWEVFLHFYNQTSRLTRSTLVRQSNDSYIITNRTFNMVIVTFIVASVPLLNIYEIRSNDDITLFSLPSIKR